MPSSITINSVTLGRPSTNTMTINFTIVNEWARNWDNLFIKYAYSKNGTVPEENSSSWSAMWLGMEYKEYSQETMTFTYTMPNIATGIDIHESTPVQIIGTKKIADMQYTIHSNIVNTYWYENYSGTPDASIVINDDDRYAKIIDLDITASFEAENPARWYSFTTFYKDPSIQEEWLEQSVSDFSKAKMLSMEQNIFTQIPNILSTTEKNNINIVVQGVLILDEYKVALVSSQLYISSWSQKYLSRTLNIRLRKLKCVEPSDAYSLDNKLQVTYRIVNYYYNIQTIDPQKFYNVSIIIYYKTSTGEWQSTTAQHIKMTDFVYEATTYIDNDIAFDESYEAFMMCTLENPGPDDIFKNKMSNTKYAQSIDEKYRKNLSLEINSYDVSLDKTNYGTNAKYYKITFECKLKNTLDYDWYDIKLYYNEWGDPDNQYVEATEKQRDNGTHTIKIMAKKIKPSTSYDFWLTGQYMTGVSNIITIETDSTEITTDTLNNPAQSLVRIYNPTTEKWFNLTKFIKVPTYNVISELVEESWDDANYVTHKICVREKIKGTFELYINSREDYYRLFDYIRLNQAAYGKSRTKLVVHLNNTVDPLSIADHEVDPDAMIATADLPYVRSKWKSAYFFVKIDDLPWQAPYYGTGNEIETIKVDIEEE